VFFSQHTVRNNAVWINQV